VAIGPSTQAPEVSGFPLNAPVVYGKRIGSFFPVMADIATANTDTVVPILLGRLPSGFHTIFTPSGGGVVTAGSLNGQDWEPQQIVVQSAAPGNYGLLVF
jgi:hypothetical protein